MIALDVSRLLSRAGRGTPSGIDRVELAYAEHLLASAAEGCFTALTPTGELGLLRRHSAQRYVAALGAAWRGEGDRRELDDDVRRIARRVRVELVASRERGLLARLRSSS